VTPNRRAEYAGSSEDNELCNQLMELNFDELRIERGTLVLMTRALMKMDCRQGPSQ
jgi:hypothetical protein